MDYLTTVLSEIGITDIIDIMIIAFIIYKIYTLISLTRAIQLLKGIIVLVVVFQLSSISGLRMVNYFLKNIITLGSLAIVVIFQPELRRTLEYLGRNRFGIRIGVDDLDKENDIINSISVAIKNLASSKIGALVVIEGETGLNDIIESGSTINAEVNNSLIENIFMPKAPLHDGATIIRKDKIIAAGCLLPLSNNRDVNRALGTRHRAALGMSAVSDALIIIASEETGDISIAHNNKLNKLKKPDDLKEILKAYYSKSEENVLGFLFKFNRSKK